MPLFYSRLLASAFRFICGAAVACLISILLLAAGFDHLVALIAPPLKSVRLRVTALVAKCRHRISFAGGLFIEAISV